MLSSKMRQLMLAGASAAILISSPLAAYAGDPKPQTTTNINLAVASNFYGTPPSNSAITDIINAFEMENPTFSVTVVDFGATGDLENHIINGNTAGVDIFLAADTDHPLDLLLNHTNLVRPYNSSRNPPLYIFNYSTGVLALLTATPGVATILKFIQP